MSRVYLDNNATTQVNEKVLEAMLPFYKDLFGNASSVHEFGRSAKMALEHSREIMAKAINANNATEIIFTSGGTESDNYAVKGVAHALRNKGKHIITSAIEHPAVLSTCKFLEKEGYEITYLPVDQYGVVDIEALKKAIKDTTILVSIMTANNEIGTIQPIKEISKVVKAKGIIFHTDAVQAFGKMPFDVKDLGVDMASFSAHKIHGPKGIGAIYLKKGTNITQFQHGGHQERNRRGGTENVPGIAGFAKAVEISSENLGKDSRYILTLRDKLYEGISKNIKYTRLNGHPKERLVNTLNVGFKYLEGESILLNLDMEGIAASTGSACTSGSLEPSHVLTAMGIEPEDAQGSIRFSLSKYNTEAEIEYVISTLPPIIERLRKMSPLYHGE